MNTPICDFVKAYRDNGRLRLHMPGHKGHTAIGPEGDDITEVDGADVLYSAKGIIRESEDNARALFGSGLTLYSAEGSSLAIRAMVYLASLYAKQQGKKPLIAAARNAHKVFMTAAALVDMDICWLFPKEPGSVVSCVLDLHEVERVLRTQQPCALYVTCPDYLGQLADVRTLSALCRRHGALLLVDNAHGAYLKFLPNSLHPMDLGADMCSDSAHKTLPVLTGGAYLHISKDAPALLRDHAQGALSLFASTSPSYLILQSLDHANQIISDGFSQQLAALSAVLEETRAQLCAYGYQVVKGEPMKLTLGAKAIGWRGDELDIFLQQHGVNVEFADPDFLVMMFSPAISAQEARHVASLLTSVEKRDPLTDLPPRLATPVQRMRPRDALFSVQQELPVEEAVGRVLASASVTCPPAVPIVVCGEEVDHTAAACFRYYGIERCFVVRES